MPSPLSTSTVREARPWPSVTYTVRQPSAIHPLVSASARAVSPRYDSGACIVSLRVSSSSSSSAANGETDHHIIPSSRARSRTSAMPHSEAAPTSIGASPPPAVAAQDAWRNSWLVATRSAALVRTRSGSQTSAIAPSGSTSSSSSMSSTRTGARDSMPSTAIPSAILLRSSPSSGWASASAAARSRTSSVSSSSRQGGAHSPCSAISSDRWSAILK